MMRINMLVLGMIYKQKCMTIKTKKKLSIKTYN